MFSIVSCGAHLELGLFKMFISCSPNLKVLLLILITPRAKSNDNPADSLCGRLSILQFVQVFIVGLCLQKFRTSSTVIPTDSSSITSLQHFWPSERLELREFFMFHTLKCWSWCEIYWLLQQNVPNIRPKLQHNNKHKLNSIISQMYQQCFYLCLCEHFGIFELVSCCLRLSIQAKTPTVEEVGDVYSFEKNLFLCWTLLSVSSCFDLSDCLNVEPV